MKHKTLKLNAAALALAFVVFFTGCAAVTSAGNSFASWWKKPQTQEGVDALKEAVFAFAFTSGLAMVDNLAKGEQVNLTKAGMAGGAAALYTAASYIRTLQGTERVLDPVATADKLREAGLTNVNATQLSDIITNNAQALTAKGVSADKASEINASAFDAAALAIQSGGLK